MEQIRGALSVFAVLVIFIFILFLAYLTTKMIAKSSALRTGAAPGGGNIQILERVALGQDRALLIVRAGGNTMLVGATAHHIEKLCDLDEGRLAEYPVKQGDSAFSGILKNVLKNGWGIGPGDGSGTGEKGKPHE